MAKSGRFSAYGAKNRATLDPAGRSISGWKSLARVRCQLVDWTEQGSRQMGLWIGKDRTAGRTVLFRHSCVLGVRWSTKRLAAPIKNLGPLMKKREQNSTARNAATQYATNFNLFIAFNTYLLRFSLTTLPIVLSVLQFLSPHSLSSPSLPLYFSLGQWTATTSCRFIALPRGVILTFTIEKAAPLLLSLAPLYSLSHSRRLLAFPSRCCTLT